MTTKITFHFTDSIEKRMTRLAEAGATKENTTLNIRGDEEPWTGKSDASLAITNEATVKA